MWAQFGSVLKYGTTEESKILLREVYKKNSRGKYETHEGSIKLMREV